MATILVAEDDAHVIRIISMWLTRNGHEVIEANDGRKAQDLLGAGDIELLVTDVNMPGCDGIQLVLWLREQAQLDIPVIILSSRCDQAKIGETLADMNVSVQPKPFSPSRLIAEIGELLLPTQAS